MECKGGAIGSPASGQAAWWAAPFKPRCTVNPDAPRQRSPGLWRCLIRASGTPPSQPPKWLTGYSDTVWMFWLRMCILSIGLRSASPDGSAWHRPASWWTAKLVGPGDATAPCTDKSPTLSRRGGGHVRHDETCGSHCAAFAGSRADCHDRRRRAGTLPVAHTRDVPQHASAPIGFGSRFRRNITRARLHRGPAARVLDGTVQPGKVFDRTVDLEAVPDGYGAMTARQALTVLVQP
jgi:hypothetical protein